MEEGRHHTQNLYKNVKHSYRRFAYYSLDKTIDSMVPLYNIFLCRFEIRDPRFNLRQ